MFNSDKRVFKALASEHRFRNLRITLLSNADAALDDGGGETMATARHSFAVHSLIFDVICVPLPTSLAAAMQRSQAVYAVDEITFKVSANAVFDDFDVEIYCIKFLINRFNFFDRFKFALN